MRVDWPLLRQLRYRWEAAQNGWNQWVLGYNSQRQQDLLERLGWPDADWRRLLPLLAAAACGALLALDWRPPGLGRRAAPADVPERLWQSLCRRLSCRGVGTPRGPGRLRPPRRRTISRLGAAGGRGRRLLHPAALPPARGRRSAPPLARLRALARAALFRRPR